MSLWVTLRYKNPATKKLKFVGVSCSGEPNGENQIVFSKLADFPAVGESDKVYIDTETSKSYIFTNNTYQLVGDGGNVAWSTLT